MHLTGYSGLRPPPPAGDAGRSASNGRLSWGEQTYNILSQYQATLDITTYLSLNKLFDRHVPRATVLGG
jgi:hypothetical protein